MKGELEHLREWKRQQIEVNKRWDAVYDYIQKHKDVVPGSYVTDTVLQFLKERDEMKEFILQVIGDAERQKFIKAYMEDLDKQAKWQ